MVGADDQKAWDAKISDVMAGRLGSEPSDYDLDLACWAIAHSPFSYITDAMLRINGGCLPIAQYNRVLSVLLQDEVLFPSRFNSFTINRKKIPHEPRNSPSNLPLLNNCGPR